MVRRTGRQPTSKNSHKSSLLDFSIQVCYDQSALEDSRSGGSLLATYQRKRNIFPGNPADGDRGDFSFWELIEAAHEAPGILAHLQKPFYKLWDHCRALPGFVQVIHSN